MIDSGSGSAHCHCGSVAGGALLCIAGYGVRLMHSLSRVQFLLEALIYPPCDVGIQLRESNQHLIEQICLQALAEIERAPVLWTW